MKIQPFLNSMLEIASCKFFLGIEGNFFHESCVDEDSMNEPITILVCKCEQIEQILSTSCKARTCVCHVAIGSIVFHNEANARYPPNNSDHCPRKGF